ncbi:hypothetical protein LX77_00850 [Gelidibacter algens]|uniref:Uncharacterized protein n=1 Tax=Gelidibacter algens TaxID=49280 RepID=A0A1A7R2T5_9FLAO|nr:DUF6252 family protein [Gelidibacter algens]OBX26570.1 hypothetical protein A9996_04570 [Gelidibacter algens]RAJ26596.1 hypothetical protein LX77_00850 [Gelidibacter algens]
MKKLFLFIIPLLCLFVLTFTSCNNDDDDAPTDPIDQLPPMTQTGENTFGCLVNGKLFVVTNNTKQVAVYQGGGLSIGGEKDLNGFFSEVSMFISETSIGEMIIENENYILNNNSLMKGQYYNDEENCFYFTNQSHTGFLKITKLDKINFIVSGSFEFQSVSEDCTDSIKITDGRFDLKYIS